MYNKETLVYKYIYNAVIYRYLKLKVLSGRASGSFTSDGCLFIQCKGGCTSYTGCVCNEQPIRLDLSYHYFALIKLYDDYRKKCIVIFIIRITVHVIAIVWILCLHCMFTFTLTITITKFSYKIIKCICICSS